MELKLQPTNDLVFQRIFGKVGNERITKKLLERILGIEIEEITLDTNKRLIGDKADDKIGRIDVKAKLGNGEKVIIEMQKAKYPNMEKRLLYYWSRAYVADLKRREPFLKLTKTIAVLVSDYKLDVTKDIEDYHTKWEIREEDGSDVKLTEDLEIHILELPKLNGAKIDTEETRWMEFIKEGEFDMSKKYDKELLEAKEELEKIAADPETRDLYFDREMALRDFINGIEGSREEGFKEGMRKGAEKEKAIQESKQLEMIKEMIKDMIKEGISIETISRISKLSIEEVEKIVNENKSKT